MNAYDCRNNKAKNEKLYWAVLGNKQLKSRGARE